MAAISGGKDSLALLWLLRERIPRIPIHYKITAVHVDPGFPGDSCLRIESFFREHEFPYRIIHTHIGPLAHGPENRENPCFLCAKQRRKRLFETAAELKCNKVALGHHKDDIIETFFLNLLYGASISTMQPVQELFQGALTLIRPLYLVDEDLVTRYSRSMGWDTIDLGCPTSGFSKRQGIKDMLKDLYRSNKKIKGNIFHALHHVNVDYLL